MSEPSLARPTALDVPGRPDRRSLRLRVAGRQRQLAPLGNEKWEFAEHGLMRLRIASINAESDRLFKWHPGHRPDDALGLSQLDS